MNRNTKKGFTIVELIIVIAVIAVLAAVLIPTFSNLINQAQQAKDTALVSDLNKGLKMSGKEFDTMHDALNAVEENVGINVAKINAVATDSEILWDSENQCFVYSKAGTINYIPDTQKTPIGANEQYKYWQIVEETSKTATYSQYLVGTDYKNDVVVNTGFDAGDNTQITSVKYTNESAREVTIRTNGGELEVNAQNDVVNHYGKSSKVVLTAVAGESYHELGEVSGDVVITKGHFVLENNAKVGTIKIADTAVANDVKLTNNANSALVVVDADNKISADSSIGSASVKVTDKDAVALIGNKSYKTLKEALNEAKDGDTVKLIADYRLDETKNKEEDRLNINSKITLNFGDYHVYGAGKLSGTESKNFAILFVRADTTFVANGGGIISEHNDADNDCGPYGVNVQIGAKLTVKSGYYFGGGTAIQVHEGTLEILGGTFKAEPYSEPYGYKYLINAIDSNFKDGTAKIFIKGGSFYKFDPADSKSENPRGEFTTDDYKVNCVDDWYTVIPA